MKKLTSCLMLFLASPLADAFADEIVHVEPNLAIVSLHATLIRAENSKITFSSSRVGPMRVDGETGELYGHGTPTAQVTYSPHYPCLWQASSHGFDIQIGGEWSGGSWGNRFRKSAQEVYLDHAVVHLFSGENDDQQNTQVDIVFKRIDDPPRVKDCRPD